MAEEKGKGHLRSVTEAGADSGSSEAINYSETKTISILQFAQWQSTVDEGFWRKFAELKLNKLKTSEEPIEVTGFYAPSSHGQVSNHLKLISESLPHDHTEETSVSLEFLGNRNRCPVPGILYNTNTLQSFKDLDRQSRQSLLKLEADKIWEDIHSGRVEEDSSLLCRFLLISFADLKKWSFYYWFAFPALVLEPPATFTKLQRASEYFVIQESTALLAACNEWRQSTLTAGVPYFLVHIFSNVDIRLRPLKDWEACQQEGGKVLLGFYDPCHLPNNPGWPLRNLIAFAAARWGLETITVLCYREKGGLGDLQRCLVADVLVSVTPDWSNPKSFPKAVGWELNNQGKMLHRRINLSSQMDPKRLAISAADLNLKLMRWRALPSLNLPLLCGTKCLILGVGTLGCQVARGLMAWGFRHITLVDCGSVATSNPLCQSLYTLDDCQNGGQQKAIAAAKTLKCIFPGLDAEGISMFIPMLGNPVEENEMENVRKDCMHLKHLVDSHDLIFLLTDTKESRWFPTLLCADANKVAITASLGFESFLVMRHGAGIALSSSTEASTVHNDDGTDSSHFGYNRPTECVNLAVFEESDSRKQRLGCYFCNGIVAPTDSTKDITLDQKCTLAQPVLAPIAAALAVELAVGIVHHPLGLNALADEGGSDASSVEQPLGILPHQICGDIAHFSQSIIKGHASNKCIACSEKVVLEYREKGIDFVLKTINQPSYLEDLMGLRALGDISLRSIYTPPLLTTKCLLLGAGTLGCQVARGLMAWGVRHITLVDCGRVSMSNPVRQSLYVFDDCLDGGQLKAIAAAKSLKRISPSVEAEGISMAIPMPGHPVSHNEIENIRQDCIHLKQLIDSHDFVYLLTDTRESRWLPTLLCADANKVAISAALGFDSFLVMRHGAGISLPSSNKDSASADEEAEPLHFGHDRLSECVDLAFFEDTASKKKRLSCYFCSDVVAPIDSTRNLTLDQQCTVTRPGLAPIAAALSVELTKGIIHHPHGINAPADVSVSEDSSVEHFLGILPHQIRGNIAHFSQMILKGHASYRCTACSEKVVSEYRERGMDFVLQAINEPSYLEDLTGLTQLKDLAESFNVDWED